MDSRRLLLHAVDASADLAAMLEVVDLDLEWTCLGPGLEHPNPQLCHGRHELE